VGTQILTEPERSGSTSLFGPIPVPRAQLKDGGAAQKWAEEGVSTLSVLRTSIPGRFSNDRHEGILVQGYIPISPNTTGLRNRCFTSLGEGGTAGGVDRAAPCCMELYAGVGRPADRSAAESIGSTHALVPQTWGT